MNEPPTLILAGAIAGRPETDRPPQAVIIHENRILTVGCADEVPPPPGGSRIDRHDHLLLPALVNAHAHLDLTHLGPQPYQGDFRAWIDLIRAGRANEDDAIADSVRLGVKLARAGGIGAIGDIAGIGSLMPGLTQRAGGLPGVSFVELFGIGRAESTAAQQVERLVAATAGERPDPTPVTFGLQPHAPYSCSLATYRIAAETGFPLATHLAETRSEIDFVQNARGPFREMLESFGLWTDRIRATGQHPIDHLAPLLRGHAMLLAHVNYCETHHLDLLAETKATVVYCPRASAYFGHPEKDAAPHRYRDMLKRGIPVALGTDSILCLNTPDRISVLDEMRFLYQRDRTAPAVLLQMATQCGADALGLSPSCFTIAPGPVVGLLALPFDPADPRDPFEQVLERDDPPEWVAGPFPYPHDSTSESSPRSQGAIAP